MSTATKSRPAAGRGGQRPQNRGRRPAPNRRPQQNPVQNFGAQAKQAFQTAKEMLRTRNGQFFLFVVQFLLSFLNIYYFKGVLKMAYYSMFYRLDIPEDERKTYCFMVSLVCILFGILMLFTRRQIVTRLVIMFSMPFYLPIILFNYDHLELLMPLAIMVVLTYLASGTSEGPKTIFGAVFLMLYILGAFVYLTVTGILQPATQETVCYRDVTPGGTYRFSIVQVLDQADGNTFVEIEPNTADIDYKHSKWYAKGYAKEVYRERPLDTFDFEWTTKSRAEITRELITHNPNTTFELNSEQMRLLGRDIGYAEDFTLGDLSRRQRHKLGYGLTTDPIDAKFRRLLHITLLDADFELTLTFDQMVELGMNPTYSQRLSRMTDDELDLLGVPEESEVLLVNGKVVFRQYVAELERTFWESSRSMLAFLESNQVPPVVEGGLDLDEIREKREEAKKAKEEEKNGGKTTEVTTETTTETTETTTETTTTG